MLKDLIMFKSSYEGKPVTLKEYVSHMKEDQKKIYFASGDSVEKISLLPQVESVVSRGYEVLYLTEDVDEFALQMLRTYSEKEFANVCNDSLDISTDEEKEKIKSENERCKDMLNKIKEDLGGAVSSVRFTGALKDHAACLSSEGMLSANMEKVLSKNPGNENAGIKAELVLEINADHPIAQKLNDLYENDEEKLADYAKLLYSNARLISGLSIEDPAEVSRLICKLMLE